MAQQSLISIINWQNITPTITKTLDFLSQPYPKQVNDFLNWYEQMAGKSLPLPQLQSWIVQGIPKMVTTLLNNEITKVDQRLQQLFTSSQDLSIKTKESQFYYESLRNLSDLMIDFVGCREELGTWYLGLLRKLINLKPVQNNIAYFEDICLRTRKQRLSY